MNKYYVERAIKDFDGRMVYDTCAHNVRFVGYIRNGCSVEKIYIISNDINELNNLIKTQFYLDELREEKLKQLGI